MNPFLKEQAKDQLTSVQLAFQVDQFLKKEVDPALQPYAQDLEGRSVLTV